MTKTQSHSDASIEEAVELDIDVDALVIETMKVPVVRKSEPDRYSIATMSLKERNNILAARKARSKCQQKKK